MRNNLLKKGLVLTLIFLFMFSVITPMTVGYNVRISDDKIITKEELKQSLNAPLDSEWPMYQHDAAHTGYSQAQFPNSFNQIWFKSYEEDLNISMVTPFNSPITSNGKIFILGDKIGDWDAVICALNQSNGSLIWKKEISPVITPSVQGINSPAFYEDKIFITLNSIFLSNLTSISKLVALDENTGDILWEKSFFGTTAYSSVTVADDKVFVGGHFTFWIPVSWLYAFDAKSGELLWGKTLVGYLETTPVVFDNKVIVTTGRQSGMIYKMAFPMFSGILRVYAFNIDNGEKIWMKRFKGDPIQCSPAAANGKLFVPSNIRFFANIRVLSKFIGRLYALDIETGDEIWHRDINQERGAWPSLISTPSVAYGKVFVTDKDGWLHVYGQDSGDLIWEKQIYPDDPDAFSDVFASPIVVDGKVIVLANDEQSFENNEFFMFNESTGELIWSINFDGWTSAPFIVSNEMLFVTDGFNGGIYAFG